MNDLRTADVPALIVRRTFNAPRENEFPSCFMAWINDTEGNSVVLYLRK